MEKSKLKIKIDNVRPGADQLVRCPLFGGEIFFEQCYRITQTISEVYKQVLVRFITPQQLQDAPACANGLIPEKLRVYAEKILELKKDWGECNRICSTCRTAPNNSPIIGSVEQAKRDYEGLQPIRR